MSENGGLSLSAIKAFFLEKEGCVQEAEQLLSKASLTPGEWDELGVCVLKKRQDLFKCVLEKMPKDPLNCHQIKKYQFIWMHRCRQSKNFTDFDLFLKKTTVPNEFLKIAMHFITVCNDPAWLNVLKNNGFDVSKEDRSCHCFVEVFKNMNDRSSMIKWLLSEGLSGDLWYQGAQHTRMENLLESLSRGVSLKSDSLRLIWKTFTLDQRESLFLQLRRKDSSHQPVWDALHLSDVQETLSQVVTDSNVVSGSKHLKL